MSMYRRIINMSGRKSNPNKGKFWSNFQSIHIYNTKAESIFKSVIITISWIGGVYLSEEPEMITKEIGAMFYLFALALIMEYLLKLITSKKIIPKVIPFCLCASNTLTVLWTSAIFFGKPFPYIQYCHLYWISIISLGIIWFDVITMILIEPSEEAKIENTLINIKNGDK